MLIPINELVAKAESHRKQNGVPLVTLSYAQSLDGSIAAVRGKPLAISSPGSQRMTHQLRAVHDAILVGIGTVLADDPQLTVRLVEGSNPQPVILDGKLNFPLTAKLLDRRTKLPWIATTSITDEDKRVALENIGARILCFPPDPDGHIPLGTLLRTLADESINSVMVEGGARVISAFLSHHLVDQVVITIAPFFVGGLRAVNFNLPVEKFAQISGMQIGRIEDDLVLWGNVIYR